MKKFIAIAALSAVAGPAFAQLNPLPPASGIPQQSIGVNAGSSHWDANPGLASYAFTSDINLSTPKPGTPDTVLGLQWGVASPFALSSRAQVAAQGGTIRAIFVGESAGWLNDFGYSLNGVPSAGLTLASNIQSETGTPYPVDLTFGDHFDIGVAAGTGANFDFWLNAVGGFGTTNPVPPTSDGGVYTAFNAFNSSPYLAPGNVRWTINPIMVNTFINATLGYQDVATYLVSFEDWRLDHGSDGDLNDFMFAVQFFKTDGTPFTPVPEPSTYGLLGAMALVGLVAHRRFKAKKVQS